MLGGGGAPLRLCTCSAPALHLLCTRSPPAPLHLRLCTTPCAPSAGFYVQPGPHAASRLPIALAPGDLIAHSFDTQHGVEVPPDIGEISRRYRGDIAEISRRYRGDSSTRSTASRCRQQSARLQPHTSTPCAAGLQPCVSGLQACVQDRVGLTPVSTSSASRVRPGCRPVHPGPDAPRRAASSSASR